MNRIALCPFGLLVGCLAFSGCGGSTGGSVEPLNRFGGRIPQRFSPPPDKKITLDEARRLGLPVLNFLTNASDLDVLHEDPDADLEISTDLVIDGRETFHGMELQLHGSSSRGYDKKSYQMKFRKGATPKLLNLFGDGGVEKRRTYILHASYQDGSFARHRISYEMIRRMGGEAPRTGYAVVAFNHRFHGLYLVIERVDEDFLETNGLEEHGLLVKAEGGLAAPWKKKSDALRGMELKSKTPKSTARNILDDFWDTLFEAPVTREGLTGAASRVLDLESFHRWQIANSYSNNMDAWLNNYFLYRPMKGIPEGGRVPLKVISWDFDAGWGHIWNGRRNDSHRTGWHNIIGHILGFAREDGYGWYGWDGFSKRLYSVPELCDSYRVRYLRALAGPAHPNAIFADIDRTYSRIEAAAGLDFDAWNRDMKIRKSTDYLKESVVARYDLMRRELEGACERGTRYDDDEPSIGGSVPPGRWPIEK